MYTKATVKQAQHTINEFMAHRHIPFERLKVDGEKGPSTDAAILLHKRCVGWRSEHVNATIGPKYRRVLHIDNGRYNFKPAQRRRGIAFRKEYAQSHTGRDRVVTFARSYVGVKEQPAGSNSGGVITTWEHNLGFGPVPWCGIFAGNMLMHVGVQNVTSRIASVSLIEDDARAGSGPFKAWTTTRQRVKPGDLVVLFGRGVHVEMVEKIDAAGVHTIGGNTSTGIAGSQSNGGCVARRVRGFSDVHGFALVRF